MRETSNLFSLYSNDNILKHRAWYIFIQRATDAKPRRNRETGNGYVVVRADILGIGKQTR
jgi:hypothetical protein